MRLAGEDAGIEAAVTDNASEREHRHSANAQTCPGNRRAAVTAARVLMALHHGDVSGLSGAA